MVFQKLRCVRMMEVVASSSRKKDLDKITRETGLDGPGGKRIGSPQMRN